MKLKHSKVGQSTIKYQLYQLKNEQWHPVSTVQTSKKMIIGNLKKSFWNQDLAIYLETGKGDFTVNWAEITMSSKFVD